MLYTHGLSVVRPTCVHQLPRLRLLHLMSIPSIDNEGWGECDRCGERLKMGPPIETDNPQFEPCTCPMVFCLGCGKALVKGRCADCSIA